MLFYWVAAIVSTAAGLTVATYPHVVKLRHCRIDKARFVGQKACLEVTLAIRLHTDARTRQVGTAYISKHPVHDNHFEMNTGTEHTLQAGEESDFLVCVSYPQIVSLRLNPDGLDRQECHIRIGNHPKRKSY